MPRGPIGRADTRATADPSPQAAKSGMKNFFGGRFGNKAGGFDSPTQLPGSDEQRRQWQSANKTWWESTPMRYDWRTELSPAPGSKEYFAEIDRRFFSAAEKFLPCKEIPFDRFISFAELAHKDVLEIGVGQGSHAQLLAPRCRSFTGIDLTEHAAEMTAKRLKVFGLPGQVLRMDAEDMKFADQSFDFVWSWGVIHHSADTRRILEQMNRVLRPGGTAAVMVYYRSWWTFYFCGFLRRIFQRQFRGQGGLHRIAQAATDGAIARYYSTRDWRAATAGLFAIDAIEICGLKTELVPLPHGGLKRAVESWLPDGLARFLLRRMRMGSFLVARMRKA
jgi:SAM-dependent methyltransferase